MTLLSKLRGLLAGKNEVVQPTTAANAPVAQAKPLETVDFSLPVSQVDKELVAAIASAILVHDDSDVTVQVKNITEIDLEKEIKTPKIISSGFLITQFPINLPESGRT